MTELTSWRDCLRPLFISLSLLSLVWAIYILWDAWPALQKSLPQMNTGWLLFTFIGNTVSSYIAFEGFRLLFNHMLPGAYNRSMLAHLYFVGQIMKHLPGRILGIAYQSNAGPRASLAQWVGVSSVYMALNTAFALWVTGIVIGLMLTWQLGLIAFTSGLIIYFLGWRPYFSSFLEVFSEKNPHSKLIKLIEALDKMSSVKISFKLHILIVFGVSWVIYLTSWAGYGMAWPGLTAFDGVWLCGIYTLAWFAGYISLVSPSGIGVRELVFVYLAKDFPPDAVAGMAVLGRVVLLSIDCTLGVLFIPFGRESK